MPLRTLQPSAFILQQGNEQLIRVSCCVLQPLGFGRNDLCGLWVVAPWPPPAVTRRAFWVPPHAGPYRRVPGIGARGWAPRRRGRRGSWGCGGGRGEPGSPLWPGDTRGSPLCRCGPGRGAGGRRREGRRDPAGCGEKAKGEPRWVQVGNCSSPSHATRAPAPTKASFINIFKGTNFLSSNK